MNWMLVAPLNVPNSNTRCGRNSRMRLARNAPVSRSVEDGNIADSAKTQSSSPSNSASDGIGVAAGIAASSSEIDDVIASRTEGQPLICSRHCRRNFGNFRSEHFGAHVLALFDLVQHATGEVRVVHDNSFRHR